LKIFFILFIYKKMSDLQPGNEQYTHVNNNLYDARLAKAVLGNGILPQRFQAHTATLNLVGLTTTVGYYQLVDDNTGLPITVTGNSQVLLLSVEATTDAVSGGGGTVTFVLSNSSTTLAADKVLSAALNAAAINAGASLVPAVQGGYVNTGVYLCARVETAIFSAGVVKIMIISA
jgi:secreted protein with Ig-like and vWFA domain